MSAKTLTTNERTAAPAPPEPAQEDELRTWAREHVERVRHLKMHLGAFIVGMLVLTPVWALVEWQDNGGFQRLDFNGDGTAGVWEPWILYVGLIWGLVVAIMALKVYFDRPTTEAEIDREVERLLARR